MTSIEKTHDTVYCVRRARRRRGGRRSREREREREGRMECSTVANVSRVAIEGTLDSIL